MLDKSRVEIMEAAFVGSGMFLTDSDRQDTHTDTESQRHIDVDGEIPLRCSLFFCIAF